MMAYLNLLLNGQKMKIIFLGKKLKCLFNCKKSDLDKMVSRLDAEYYQHFNFRKKIKEQKTKTIREDDGIFDCSAFYPSIVGAYNFSGKVFHY